MSIVDPHEYAEAFERNCPHLRMVPDEKEELRRLFMVAIKAAQFEADQKLIALRTTP